MNWVEWLFTLIGKAVLVSATVLLSLASSGTLTEFLKGLLSVLNMGLDSTGLLLALVTFFVASVKYWPEVVAAIPGGVVSTKAKNGGVSVSEGMRII